MYKQLSSTCDKVRVIFELPACLWADRIYVVGDFNQWQPTATPLKQTRDGVWHAEVELLAGHRYEFRYLIDGKWQAEIHADGARPTELGCDNSVVDTTLITMQKLRGAAPLNLAARSPAPTHAHRLNGRAQPLKLPVAHTGD